MHNASVLTFLVLGLAVASAPAQNPRAGKEPPSKKDEGSSKGSSGIKSYAGKTLAQWKLELTNPDASKRAVAILAIIQFGDDAAECVPLLIDRTKDQDVSPRAKALLALRHVGIDNKDIPKVVKAVSDRLNPVHERQAVIRYEAAMTLGRFIEDADSAIPVLIQAIQDVASWEIRHTCVSILWRVGTDKEKGADPRAVKAMLDALQKEKTYAVRLELLQGLGAMGRPDDPLLLQRLVKDMNNYARSTNVTYSIWGFVGLVAITEGAEAERALSSISKLLRSERLETRTQAAQALGALGKRAKNKVPDLLKMLKDKEAMAVHSACVALSNIGDNSDRVIDALLEVAEHKDVNRAAAGIMALFTLKATPNRALKMFDRMRQDKELNIGLRNLIEQGLKAMEKPK